MTKSSILSVHIVGNNRDAKRKLSDTERSLDRLNKSAAASGVKLSRMYQQLDNAAGVAVKVGAVTTAMQAMTIATVRTGKALAPLAGLLAVVPGAAAAGGAALATFKTATSGFGEAVAAAGEGTEKFNEATKGMAPSMVSAARAAGQMTKAFGDVRKTVQGSFWQGIDKQITALSKVAMPALAAGMSGVAGAGNKVFTELLRVAGTQPVMDAMSASFAAAQRALQGLAPAVAPFITGLSRIVGASAGLIKGFTGAEGAAKRFNKWATRITSDGSLAKWFEEGKTAAKQLGSILASAGRALGAVGRAAMAAAGDGGGLGRFADIMKRVAAVVSSPAMQTQMTESFTRANAVASAFANVLIAVLPTIARFGPELLLMGMAWKAASTAAALYRGAVMLTTAAQTVFGSKAVVSLAKVAAGWVKTAAASMLAGARMAAAWLLALGPIGLIIAAVGLVVAAIVVAYNKCTWFRNGVNAVMNAVKGFVTGAASWLKSKFSSAVSSVVAAYNGLKSRAAAVFNAVKSAAGAAASFFSSKFNVGVAVVVGKFNSLKSNVSGVASRIKSALSGAASGMSSAFSRALSGVTGVFNRIVGAARSMASRVSSIISSIRSAASSATSMFSFFSDGGFQMRATVASNLPDPGQPFRMEAAGQVLSPVRLGGSGGGSVVTNVTNITIEGALDPVAVGRQIEKLVKGARVRYGSGAGGGFL